MPNDPNMPSAASREAAAEAVLLTDPQGRVVGTNRPFDDCAGLAAAELLQLAVACDDGAEELRTVASLIGAALADRQPRQGRARLPGQAAACGITLHPLFARGEASGCMVVLQLPRSDGDAARQGFDPATGLPDRHLFADRVEQALHVAGRAGKSLAIILVGCDRLGEINDVLGEHAAQRIVRDMADRLRQCVRSSDTVARLGSDRFAFVMQIASTDDSVLLIEKIAHALERPFTLDNRQDVAMSGAIGVSIFPTDGSTPDELVKKAAIALHHARQGGRNAYQYFSDEMNARARHRLHIESGMRRALADREFLVYYQPKIDVKDRRIAGMEALVRWRDPQRGLVPPGEFIPIAEESGLIEQIGQWVMEETCRQSRSWQEAGLPCLRASVNVSARQFRHRDFVSQVEATLRKTGLDPRWLELEITESMLMGDIESIVARMEDLRRLGVSLSIDDFGTGYSSLSYLSRFPITTLKIDRAFIVDVQSNPHTAEITRAIIGLSRGLELEVVAEGAEVAEQVEFLRMHGCEIVQGYFYSKPLPAEEFAALLRGGPGLRPA